MFSLKKWHRVLFIILLLLILVSAYSWSRWQNLKQELGLDVNWQGLSISFQGIKLSHLTVKQWDVGGSLTELKGQGITLSWSNLLIKELNVTWKKGDLVHAQPSTSTEPFNIDNTLNTISWVPHHLQIDKLIVTLPCAIGQCTTQGNIVVDQKQQTNMPLSLMANLQHKEQHLTIDAKLYKRQQLLDLQLNSQLNNQSLLKFSSQLDTNRLNQWQGQLDIFKLTNAQGLFNWLQEWLPTEETVNQVPDSLELSAKWQLHFADSLTSFRPNQGFFSINATLPNPWPLIGVGYLQGTIQTKVSFNQRPRIEQLHTDIKLTHIDKALLQKIPTPLQPETLGLTLKPIAIPDNITADRAIAINLNTTGNINTLFTSDIYINTPQAQILFNNGLLQANTKTLALADYSLQNGRLSLPFNATLTPKETHIQLDKTALLNLQQFTSPDISAKNLQFTVGNLTTQINYQDRSAPIQLSVTGPITASTTALTQTMLNTLSWKITGQLNANLKQASFNGKVTNGADLATTITAKTDYVKDLNLTAKTPDLFFRTTNIFAKTFKDWPNVLEIVTGKINLNGSATIAFTNSPIKANAIAKFSGLSGIYDRSEFRDLSGSTTLTLKNNQLTLAMPDLALTEANPGINMGPMQFNGHYTAQLNKLTQGILQWSKAELTLFTGNVWLKAGQLNLAKLPQQLDLQIKNVQLSNLLQAYPTEGLNGEGILDGTLPIIITRKGIDVKEGKLGARQSGFIKFDSPKIKAVGANNPNMKLVTEALENFHYTLLNSQVSYDNGKAILGLQISGRNPEVKGGQPINLNITLQEDIPALLTTLQLSDRVSETIRQRVQKSLQQSSSKNQ